jgi:predicted amidohydrolase YtcJ
MNILRLAEMRKDMTQISRRGFIAQASALVAMPFSRLTPEVILHHGRFWTGNRIAPYAQALAIADGRVLAVGDDQQILSLASPQTKRIDLNGKTVLPGFNDAHAHPIESGVDFLWNVACDKSLIREIQDALRTKAAQTIPGEWVRGFLYDDGKTPRPINIHDLDEALPAHPVLVTHRGGHTAFANSYAFKLAGITDATPNPAGGLYEHDLNGHLTGRIGDNAVDPFAKLSAYHPSRDDYRNGAALITKMFSSKGITSVCDAAGTSEDLQGYQDARDADTLKCRVYCHILAGADFERAASAGIHTGFGDDWVRVGAVKQFADGSISERTAWLSKPYLDIVPPYSGLQTATREALYENSKRAHAAGWQLGIHANGDLAITEVLGIYEQLQREIPRPNTRHRIEHCTLVDPSIVDRIRLAKAIPVPFASYAYFHGDIMHFYGDDRAKSMFAMRWFLDAGIPVPTSSDYGASPSDAMMFLLSLVSRKGMDGHAWGLNQRISLDEAIRCATANGAYCTFEEKSKGTLEPGKLADLVVLHQDPWKTDVSEIRNIGIERTMTGGKWVYES